MDERGRHMKMRHDVDATTLPTKAKAAVAAAAVVVLLAVGSGVVPVHDVGKARHDCFDCVKAPR